MKISHIQARVAGFLLAAFVIGVDQWSKAFVVYIATHSAFPLTLLPFFNLVLAWNSGISFGMFARLQEWMPRVIIFTTSLVVVMLVIWLLRAKERATIVALGFVIGGAVGNIIDRMRLGAVADFLDFHIGHYHWPAFNVADSAIFIGVVILILTGIMRPSEDKS